MCRLLDKCPGSSSSTNPIRQARPNQLPQELSNGTLASTRLEISGKAAGQNQPVVLDSQLNLMRRIPFGVTAASGACPTLSRASWRNALLSGSNVA